MSDKLTPEEMAKVKAKYPVSSHVETLSLGGDFVRKTTGMTVDPCGPTPVHTPIAQGTIYGSATDLRRARKERGRANLLPRNAGSIAELERTAWNAALVKARAQTALGQRFLVRVTSIRKRLLDEDNLCEKYHVDLLRYSGVLPADDPSQTHIEVCQRKADPGEGEHVIIEVFKI